MSDHFQATAVRSESGPTIVLRGTVNRAAKETLEAVYAEVEDTEGEIRLDFTHVDYINSTGIAVIVGLLARARATARDVGASGLTEHYKEVFEITRLSDFMHIYNDADSNT